MVDAATMIVQGKQGYEKIVVGVDPGKTYGIAVLGDNKVLATLAASNVDEASHLVLDRLNRFPAETRTVRVGDGPNEYTQTLLDSLNGALPEDTAVEIVSEAGTSKIASTFVNRRVLRDTVSAIKIAGRNGRILSRRSSESVSYTHLTLPTKRIV